LKIEKQTQQPKGYGFCEFIDKDVASSALRNLAKYDLNKRELKVDYASDNKNGTNLRPEDVTYRDIGDLNLVFAAMMTLSSNLKNVPMSANNL
jgi:cleavage stimulation factor subunit 2